jgi:hypothetical protein
MMSCQLYFLKQSYGRRLTAAISDEMEVGMSNRMSSIWYGLVIIIFTVLSGGCTGNSSGGSTLIVTVTDQSGIKVPDVTVVLGDSNGAMKAHGTTNSNGQITFTDSPANATVTAAARCLRSGETTTTHDFSVQYDVNEPVNFTLNTCSGSPSTSPSLNATAVSALGMVTVNVTNTINGVVQDEVFTNYEPYGSVITQQTFTLTIYSYQLQSDGKLSLVAIGKDANGAAVGYGMLLDQTFTDGMIANITVDKPMNFIQYAITNIPNTATSLYANIMLSRIGKGNIQLTNLYSFSSAPTSTTINVAYIPALGDWFNYGVSIVHNENNNGTLFVTQQNMFRSSGTATTPSDQGFDLNQALAAPSEITVSGANTSTPTLSWLGIDPLANSIFLNAEVRLSPTEFLNFYITNLSSKRTSIIYPELPEALADFTPIGVTYVSISYNASEAGMYKISGAEYFPSQTFAAALKKQTRTQ